MPPVETITALVLGAVGGLAVSALYAKLRFLEIEEKVERHEREIAKLGIILTAKRQAGG